MRRTIFFIAFLLLSAFVFAQEELDVVYLKNGTILKGKITEQVPNEQLKIKTIDGNYYSCKFSDVEKIALESIELNLNDYGGKFSYGFALGGGGLLGVPIRFYPSPKLALELGAYFQPRIRIDNFDSNVGLLIAGGTNIFLGRSFNRERGKVKLNGISLKAGYSFANYPESMFSIGWAHESFKKENKNRSIIIELGFGIEKLPSEATNVYSNGEKTQPLFYWKCNWNWYAKN